MSLIEKAVARLNAVSVEQYEVSKYRRGRGYRRFDYALYCNQEFLLNTLSAREMVTELRRLYHLAKVAQLTRNVSEA